MLVLSRRVGESVEIGDGIIVMVVDIQGGKAKIGIEAPRGTPVHRSEVGDRIRRAQRSETPAP